MKRSRLAAALLAASLGLGLATLLSPTGTVEADETYTMKFATVAPEGTPWERQMREFKRYVEEQSGGRIKVKAFMGGSLGGEKALVRRTAQGSLQAFGGSVGALGTIVTELNVMEAPYLFPNLETADAKLDGAAKDVVRDIVNAKGFQFGFWAENGYRSWFTKERPIRTPADLNGLRMRSQESPVHLDTYRALGANPVPIDVTNVLTSLQTGVVDGFDNSPLFAFATSWYQAAKHLNVSEHSYQPGVIVYSKRWYSQLPDDLKQVLDNVPQSIVVNARQGVRRMEPILLRNLAENHGVTVHRPSAEEKAAFARITSKVADKVAKKAGAKAVKLLKALR